MQPIPLQFRVALADKFRTLKNSVAETITEEFFCRHPDWLARYGELGRQRGIEDAVYHLEFLAGAFETGSATPFVDYACWTAGRLRARGIAPTFLAENLRQLNGALGQHLTDAERAMLADFIQLACDVIESGPTERGPGEAGKLDLTRSVFLQVLLQGHRKAAATIVLEALREGHPILDIYAEVLQEALYTVGWMWETNEISVAQEHTATAIAQYVLALLYERMVPPDIRRGKAVITGVEGELHHVGANMVADALETDGWDVRFLGTDMPHEGILNVVEDHGAELLGISATMLFNLPKVRQLVADTRQRFGAKVRIFVGGGAFRSAPNLPAEIGADGSAPGLREAIDLVRAPAGLDPDCL